MKALIQRLIENPKTTHLGLAVGALFAVGTYFTDQGTEPLGAILMGISGALGAVGLFMAKD